MSINLTLRATTIEEWSSVTKSSDAEIHHWLFARRPPTPLGLSPRALAKLSREERIAVVNQMFECCEAFTDRAVLDYRWSRMVDVVFGLKSGVESVDDGSEMPHLLVGSSQTNITSLYGKVRVFPRSDILASISRIELFDWNSVSTDTRLVLAHPDLAFLHLETIPENIEEEVWYTIDRIRKLFKRFCGGDHVIVEYLH